ncbi:MAG: sulfate adenylyltransferase subunit CysD [Actinomycetales bacterium]|nr:sulfate adenylyltransferase subunit CysD [Actinomycetales bacterium]
MHPATTAGSTISPDDVLDHLEAEAIGIIRETAAAFRTPVLLYSIGKDSSVLLHLARKAFHPGEIPFPLLHVDSQWEFAEMIEHRDRMAREVGFTLLVAQNDEGIADGVSPLTHGIQEYTRIMRTVPLLRALQDGGFDAAIGGGRRDEERSRAKERIFSLREARQRWDPRNQRPEFWRTVNTTLVNGQTMRVFPISNWTELDVWRYIRRERIDVVDLYFARPRPVIERDGTLIVVDDDRMPLEPDERPVRREVRFRTLGCWPVTGAIDSTARDIDDLVTEMEQVRVSERAGRLIDGDRADSMEAKKRAGYF